MNETGESHEKLLDPSATKAIQELLAGVRTNLLLEAARLSDDQAITSEHLWEAYQRLCLPDKGRLQWVDAQAIISTALSENRKFEWLACGMAILLFVFGLTLLSVGILDSDVATRAAALIGGSIAELLILLPFRVVINSRQNIALRMLGIVINRVDDPKKLAPLLKDTFLAVVLNTPTPK